MLKMAFFFFFATSTVTSEVQYSTGAKPITLNRANSVAPHIWKNRFLVDWRLLVKESITYIGILLNVSGFCGFDDFLRFESFLVFWSLWTSLLCIVGDLAEGWFVAVAVGVSDRWQVTVYRWHATRDTWHLTCNTWHLTQDTWHFFLHIFLLFLSALVLVLLSANVMRWRVSRITDKKKIKNTYNVNRKYKIKRSTLHGHYKNTSTVVVQNSSVTTIFMFLFNWIQNVNDFCRRDSITRYLISMKTRRGMPRW